MNKRIRNIIAIIGIISGVIGVIGAVPFFLMERFAYAVLATILVVLGLILLAIAFGE